MIDGVYFSNIGLIVRLVVPRLQFQKAYGRKKFWTEKNSHDSCLQTPHLNDSYISEWKNGQGAQLLVHFKQRSLDRGF